MGVIEYKGYKIRCFPESFEPPVGGNPLEDVVSAVDVAGSSGGNTTLKFIVPFTVRATSDLKTEEVVKLAISKVKELIDGGLAERESDEFMLMSGSRTFEPVVDLTN